MRAAIAGGTGFIGKHLTAHWRKEGAEIVLLSRKAAPPRDGVRTVAWEEAERHPELLEGLDVLVNLAGETINQRWTKEAKARILDSRLQAAASIAGIVAKLERKPIAVIQSSAVGIYGASETAVFNESDARQGNEDFLAMVSARWESAADPLAASVRLVKLRTGVVLGTDGGALPKMLLPYRLGAGGRIGNGRQWISWIHIADLVRLLAFCAENPTIRGPVNAVAPEPVTNDAFGRTVGRVLHRPHWLPVPAAALKLALGEMSELVLEGQRVVPEAALRSGFPFLFPEVEKALRNLLKA